MIWRQKNDELLAEEGIFGDEIGLTACKISSGAENNRVARGLGEVQESLFSTIDETAEQLGQPMEEGEHVAALQESCQKLSDDCIKRSYGVKFHTDGVFSQHSRFDGPVLSAALIVGLLNWIWHLPVFFLPGYADAFRAIPLSILQMFFVVLPAVILYTWIYNNTGRSVLAAMLFHFGGNFWREFFGLSVEAQTCRMVLTIIAVAIIVWWRPAALRREPGPAFGH